MMCLCGRTNENENVRLLCAPFVQVDFDDKHPDEHLQILNDVLASLNADLKTDLRVASRDMVVENMRHFLIRHKCKCALFPDHNDGFGQKEVIYQILHWVLSNYEHLRKEEYLARYLTPFDVPSEYHLSMSTNVNLRELLDAYKELQAEVRKWMCIHRGI